MSYTLKYLIDTILIKKLLKSGKQTKSNYILSNLDILTKKNNLFQKAILHLLVPVEFKSKKVGSITYNIPILIHYLKSIHLAVSWIIKAAKIKSINKVPMYKSLYLESIEVLKNQGLAYSYKQQHIKKALINRIFIYLIAFKKNKIK